MVQCYKWWAIKCIVWTNKTITSKYTGVFSQITLIVCKSQEWNLRHLLFSCQYFNAHKVHTYVHGHVSSPPDCQWSSRHHHPIAKVSAQTKLISERCTHIGIPWGDCHSIPRQEKLHLRHDSCYYAWYYDSKEHYTPKLRAVLRVLGSSNLCIYEDLNSTGNLCRYKDVCTEYSFFSSQTQSSI